MKANSLRYAMLLLAAIFLLAACEVRPTAGANELVTRDGPQSDLLLKSEDLPAGWAINGTGNALPGLRDEIPAIEALVVSLAGETVHQSARQRFIRFPNQEVLDRWWPILTSGPVDFDLPWLGEINILDPDKMPPTHADRMASRCDAYQAATTIVFCVVRLAYGPIFTDVEVSFRRDDGLPDAIYELIAALDRRMQLVSQQP